MTINIRSEPGDKIIELGGGNNPRFHPNVDVRACWDREGKPTVDFTADFNEPLPISSDEWDCVYSSFAIEHVAYPNVPQFVAEVFRILKQGGKAIIVCPNTEAQLKWVLEHPHGWDGKSMFESASCKLFGDQRHGEQTGSERNYGYDSHKAYFSPTICEELFGKAGFVEIQITLYGARQTDLVVVANKSGLIPQKVQGVVLQAAPDKIGGPVTQAFSESAQSKEQLPPPEILFGRDYWDGGKKFGGYGPPIGYWDFPAHEVTSRHILARGPESVLELGCARGYVLKRIQDAGVNGVGIDVSKHCFMTRVADNIILGDLCKSWPMRNAPKGWTEGHPHPDQYDLCYSIAVLDHLSEASLPDVIREMTRTCKRGLHGINFGPLGSDKTRQTIRSREWWQEQFRLYAPGWPVEVVNKDELESGPFPEDVAKGDGKVKLNLGSFITMFHHGWTNIDLHDLGQFAQANGFQFKRHDLRQGLPYPTSSVDLIYSSHFLEHLTYEEGLRLLKDCRRVIKANGAMRLIVPDSELLLNMYHHRDARIPKLDDLGEISESCEQAPTALGKLHALLQGGEHKAFYDAETLLGTLEESGFKAFNVDFCHTVNSNAGHQILRETLDMSPCLSLYVDAAVAE